MLKSLIGVEIKEFISKFNISYKGEETEELHDNDFTAIKSGYITLTPLALHSNELFESALHCLKKWESDMKHPKLLWFHRT